MSTSGCPWPKATVKPPVSSSPTSGPTRHSLRGNRTRTGTATAVRSGPGFQALNARFQDLDLRTWVSGPRYLALRTWVSGPRKLSILRSSYLFPVTFLCVQWSQTDEEEEEESERRTGLCILIHRQDRFCHRKCRPVPPVGFVQ
jgi:hypothetical protein